MLREDWVGRAGQEFASLAQELVISGSGGSDRGGCLLFLYILYFRDIVLHITGMELLVSSDICT